MIKKYVEDDCLKFEDLNETTKYFANKLWKSEKIKSSNIINKNTYKNELGGELLQQFFIIKNPTKILGTWKNHKFYKWWLYGEILSEFLNFEVPVMYKYKPKMFNQHYKLLEDGRMQYSYGNRFMEFNQFVNIYNKLKENPNSKRCVIDIYTPYDTSPNRVDSPCTLMYTLIQRNGKLNMSVFYRSWDFFGGFKTYDVALSSFILQSFCSWLRFKPGNLGIYVNSLHYYNRDKNLLKKLVKEVNSSNRKSDILVINEKINITNFYNQLRSVKACEEAAYNQNFEKANKIKNLLKSNNIFYDMCNCWMNKNRKMKDGR